MKLNFKQIWVLAAMLLASLSVSAADFEVDGICYDITSIENRECEVAAKEGGYEGTVEIPSKVTYSGQELTVVQIGYGAFENCSQLNKITLDEGIQSIGQDAFSGCSSLTQMIFPEGIESIGSWAFYECSSLTEIKLPNSLKEIGSAAFWGCSSIIEITIPDNVTTIGDDAFRSCSSLKSLIIGGVWNPSAIIYANPVKVCKN